MTEHEFQLCWKKLLFNHRDLRTLSGKQITIKDPGYWNNGPGPDFKHAILLFDSVELHGSVEMHINSLEWFSHNHHLDSNYNNVILHVIYNSSNSTSEVIAQNQAGNPIETLYIQPFELKTEKFELPCKSTFISRDALNKQLEIASSQYINKLSLRILADFKTSFGLELGFKYASINQLFHLIGKPFYEDLAKDFAERYLLSGINNSSPIPREAIAMFKPLGRGKNLTKRIELAIELANFFKKNELPSSFREFEHFSFELTHFIYQLFGKGFWAQHITRSWLLVTGYTWASLIYSTSAMDYFLGKWRESALTVPESIVKQESYQFLKNKGAEFQEKNKTALLMDQYKIFCANKQCVHCNLSGMQTGS